MARDRSISKRIREVRSDLYGEYGIPALAEALGIQVDTWINYEHGIPMHDHVLLEFLALTGADPHWLLTGEGERLSTRGGSWHER